MEKISGQIYLGLIFIFILWVTGVEANCKVPHMFGKVGESKRSPSGKFLALANSGNQLLKIKSEHYKLIVLKCGKTGTARGFEPETLDENGPAIYVKNIRWASEETSLTYDIAAGKSHRDLILKFEGETKLE